MENWQQTFLCGFWLLCNDQFISINHFDAVADLVSNAFALQQKVVNSKCHSKWQCQKRVLAKLRVLTLNLNYKLPKYEYHHFFINSHRIQFKWKANLLSSAYTPNFCIPAIKAKHTAIKNHYYLYMGLNLIACEYFTTTRHQWQKKC